MPSAAISSRNPTFMLPGPPPSLAHLRFGGPRSVRGRERLGVLEGHAAIADRERALPRLAAQQLQPDLLVDVALPDLGALGVRGIQLCGPGVGCGDDHGMPAAAEIDVRRRAADHHDLGRVHRALPPRTHTHGFPTVPSVEYGLSLII